MKEKIAIIGAGNVGLSLAHVFSKNGFEVRLASRHRTSSQQISSNVEICSTYDAVSDSNFILLTVPDSAITGVCESLATQFKKGSIVLHCSGAMTSKALQSARAQGCLVASAHPLNTFPNPTAAIKLLSQSSHNTYLYCEGDDTALKTVNSVFSTIGFNTLTISSSAKPLYHAACVFACNYMTVLMDLSLQTAEAAKLDRDDFWDSIQPLIQSTLSNISPQNMTTSLSGPVARADIETVQKHIQMLASVSNDLRSTYLDMAAHAVTLAKKNNHINDQKMIRLNELSKFISNKS